MFKWILLRGWKTCFYLCPMPAERTSIYKLATSRVIWPKIYRHYPLKIALGLCRSRCCIYVITSISIVLFRNLCILNAGSHIQRRYMMHFNNFTGSFVCHDWHLDAGMHPRRPLFWWCIYWERMFFIIESILLFVFLAVEIQTQTYLVVPLGIVCLFY